jgi:hypothetical protein
MRVASRLRHRQTSTPSPSTMNMNHGRDAARSAALLRYNNNNDGDDTLLLQQLQLSYFRINANNNWKSFVSSHFLQYQEELLAITNLLASILVININIASTIAITPRTLPTETISGTSSFLLHFSENKSLTSQSDSI